MDKGELNLPEVNLVYEEEVELRYLFLKGYKWLARNEMGMVKAFKDKPCRRKSLPDTHKGGYDSWVTSSFDSVWTLHDDTNTEFGMYDFIQWEDEPVLIEDLYNLRGVF